MSRTTALTDVGYRFKTEPWAKQLEVLERSWNRKAWGLFCEQGTGKSKVLIDTTGLAFVKGWVEGLVVVAPDGVQRDWIDIHLAKHCAVPYRAAVYETHMTKKGKEAYERQLYARDDAASLKVLTISYDTLITDRGEKEVQRFLNTFKSMLCVDESHKVSNAKAARTLCVKRLSKKAYMRRVMTGTPVKNNPFSVYHQCEFLEPGLLGFQTYTAFKAQYAVMEAPDSGLVRHIQRKLVQKYGRQKAERMAPQIVSRDSEGRPMYRNLEDLAERMSKFSSRVLKTDMFDLPPKVYIQRTVPMSKAQAAVYEALASDCVAEYNGKTLTAELAIVRATRLQQITGGFFVPDIDDTLWSDDRTPVLLDPTPPKLASLLDFVEEDPDAKLIVWARFKAELNMIANRLAELYGVPAVTRYWGEQNSNEKADAKKRFITDERCKFFVSQPQSGGTGLDGLQDVCTRQFYYSNVHPLVDRLQSEDRLHRGGQTGTVLVVDSVTSNSVDQAILNALRAHKEVADIINRDPREWVHTGETK
jgi:SNF2 family DNA or RNA helicase